MRQWIDFTIRNIVGFSILCILTHFNVKLDAFDGFWVGFVIGLICIWLSNIIVYLRLK